MTQYEEELKSKETQELVAALKKLVAEGYKLNAQHNNPSYRKALETAEELVIKHKLKKSE